MLIIPAIDLLGGKVVRLTKGDPNQSTVYSEEPLAVARKWEKEGVRLIHVVDLNAALGQGNNTATIKKIIKAVKIKVEVGGGIREIKKAEDLLAQGAERIIVGTKSIDERFVEKLLRTLGSDKVAVGVDVADGFVAVRGWQEKTTLIWLDFIGKLAQRGVKWFVYTDISRDGTLSGINSEAIKQLSSFKGLNFIISGGVSSLGDLVKIRQYAPFAWGVIIGKALYEGKMSLKEASASLAKAL